MDAYMLTMMFKENRFTQVPLMVAFRHSCQWIPPFRAGTFPMPSNAITLIISLFPFYKLTLPLSRSEGGEAWGGSCICRNIDTMRWKVQPLNLSTQPGSASNCPWRVRGPSSISVSIYVLRKGMCVIPRVGTKVGEKVGKVSLKTFPRPLQSPKAHSPVFFFSKKPGKQLIISVCKTFLKITASETDFLHCWQRTLWVVPSEQDKSLSVRTEACVKMKMEVGPVGGSQPSPPSIREAKKGTGKGAPPTCPGAQMGGFLKHVPLTWCF